MKKIEKTVWSQDSYFKTERKYSGETSINLSNDIYRFLGGVSGQARLQALAEGF